MLVRIVGTLGYRALVGLVLVGGFLIWNSLSAEKPEYKECLQQARMAAAQQGHDWTELEAISLKDPRCAALK